MTRSARDVPRPTEPPKPPPTVINQGIQQQLAAQVGDPNKPVRTLIMFEAADASPQEVRAACAAIAEHYGHSINPTFVVPVRGGRLSNDIMFESEILDMVNKICEVRDGQIVLRGGATEVTIMRHSI